MNLNVSSFPDPPEDIIESLELSYREEPINEEHEGQVGDDEIVVQYNAQVQAIWHKFSFFRGDNLWKDFHEINQIVIYLEGADLNENPEGLSIIL
jgi:hypothetical protein